MRTSRCPDNPYFLSLCLFLLVILGLTGRPGDEPLQVPLVGQLPGAMRVGVRVPLFFVRAPGRLPAGRVAIIIDDLGCDPAALEGFAALRAPLTVSVIPAQRWSSETALRALRLGYQVMIHLPMEPLNYPGDEPQLDMVQVGMGRREVARLFDAAVVDVPGAVGLNNHMGSRATRSPALMREVLSLAKANGLFFIDSRTTSRSVAYETARELKVPAGYREVFLDSVRSPALIRSQLRTLMALARRHGGAIGIGHPFPETLEAVREVIPNMKTQGIALVYAGQLTR